MNTIVVGIDEVGRGPWAGPVVSAAVALRSNQNIEGVADSKLLSKRKREVLAHTIKQQATDIGIGWVSPANLDALGLSSAVALSMKFALEQLGCTYSQIIVDGSIDYLHTKTSTAIPRADQLHMCVSAASIIAKVARDNYMKQISKLYPGYGFENHVGYGTKMHMNSLEKLGISPIHRTSFAPIMALQR